MGYQNVTLNSSNLPIWHKHATSHSMINKRRNLALNHTDCNTEINTIKCIAQENDYCPQLIETLIKMQILRNCNLICKNLPLTNNKHIHNAKISQQIHTENS